MSRKSEPMFVGEYGIVCIHSIKWDSICETNNIAIVMLYVQCIKCIKIDVCYI